MGWMSAIVTSTRRWALNIYITRWRLPVSTELKVQVQLVWRPDPLVTRCGRESQHPGEWAPGPRLSSPGERERNAAIANRVRGNMLQFCLVSNTLSNTTLSNKVRGIFFKELCRSSLLLCCRLFGQSEIQHYYVTLTIQFNNSHFLAHS